MPYKGTQQGQSGMNPKKVGAKGGAHDHSANYMYGVSTPNTQGWNGYDSGPERGGAIKGHHRGMKKSGGNMDY